MQLSSLTKVFLCSSECPYLFIHIIFWKLLSLCQSNSEVKFKALILKLVKKFLEYTQADVKTRNTKLLRKNVMFKEKGSQEKNILDVSVDLKAYFYFF